MRLAGMGGHRENRINHSELIFKSQRLEFSGLNHRQNRPDIYDSADGVGNHFWAYNLFHFLMLEYNGCFGKF